MTPEPYVEPYPGPVKLVLWLGGAGLGMAAIVGVFLC